MKIFDCITFYDENLITNARFEILDKVVDHHVICESKYDHSGNKKKLNFKLKNNKFKKKISYLVIDQPFEYPIDQWNNEDKQRNFLFHGIETAEEDDIILFSDSDEIPNPKKLKNLNLKKKYGIFLQNFYVGKFNIFNSYESPWEGTRVCKKKNLVSFTHLRKNILKKNIKKSFWKFYIEKDIEIIKNGGWHFNNFYDLKTISEKIKTFPHTEYNKDKFTNVDNIKKRLNNLEDIFDRGYKFKKVKIDNSYPEYILNNLKYFRKYTI